MRTRKLSLAMGGILLCSSFVSSVAWGQRCCPDKPPKETERQSKGSAKEVIKEPFDVNLSGETPSAKGKVVTDIEEKAKEKEKVNELIK